MISTRFFPAIALCFLLSPLARGAEITLVRDGVAQVFIQVAARVLEGDHKLPAGAPAAATEAEQARQRLRESARDLARCLEKISGAPIQIVTNLPAGAPARLPILIGELATQRFGPPAKKSPHQQAWRLVANAQGLGLTGESDEASSYAIYELLDQLGCRWFLPGDLGEVLPESRTVRIAAQDVSAVPGTISRHIWYADEAFRRRNRQGGFKLSAGHALEISGYLTKEQLTAHPDWNAELNGKRSINGRYCWGNPEVSDALADAISARLDKTPARTVSLSPDDGAHFCECARCRALDAGDWDESMNRFSSTDRFVHFCNRIATRVTRKHPDVLFGFLAYVQYTRPPVRERLHPNLVPLIAPITYCRAHAMTDPQCPSRQQLRRIAEGWGRTSETVAYYNYMFHLAEVAVPYPMMRQMSEELPLLYRNKVKLWNPETMPNFESILPGMWLAIRMSWHTQAEPRAVLDEFFTRFYGAAEAPMRRYWQHFDDAWNQVPDHAGCGWSYLKRFPPAFLKTARETMDAALAAARTPLEYRRVKLQDDALRQFERFMALREDLAAGRYAHLDRDSLRWQGAQLALADEHAASYSFNRVGWSTYTIAGGYFRTFFGQTYEDAAKLAKSHTFLAPAIRQWRFQTAPEKTGEARGWTSATTDDKAWRTMDSCVDTWSGLGLDKYFGHAWYRATVRLPAVPAGRKTFLWISASDGALSAWFNGQPLTFTNRKGETTPDYNRYAEPISVEITHLLKPNAPNTLVFRAHRTDVINELGTGGLLGPVGIYREK